MSDFTVDSLKEFILAELNSFKAETDRRFGAQQKEVETAFNAAKEAVLKSELGVEKRSDAVYVTIAKLQDALALVMPRAEAEQRFSSLNEKIDELKSSRDTNEGRTTGGDITMTKIVTTIGVVGTILGIIVLLANNVFGK